MKRTVLSFFTFVNLALVLTLPTKLTAQQVKYKVIDLGTLGGPHSYGSVNGEGFALISNSGIVASLDLGAVQLNATLGCYVPD